MDANDRVIAIYVVNDPHKKGENSNLGKERVRTVGKVLKKLRKDLPDFMTDNIPVLSEEEEKALSAEEKSTLIKQRMKERNELIKKKSWVQLENIEFDTLNKMADAIDWNGSEPWKNVDVGNRLFDLLESAQSYDPE